MQECSISCRYESSSDLTLTHKMLTTPQRDADFRLITDYFSSLPLHLDDRIELPVLVHLGCGVEVIVRPSAIDHQAITITPLW